MEFEPLTPAVLANVRALNGRFLDCIAAGTDPLLAAPPQRITAIRELRPVQRARLAECPFLLFAPDCNNADRWARLFRGTQRELAHARSRDHGSGSQGVLAAAIAFLWQLSQHNLYAARLVSGASLGWCERLAEQALVDVVQAAADEPGLLGLRRARDTRLWNRLLGAGVSMEADIAAAARLAAWQLLMTRGWQERGLSRRAAACAAQAPAARSRSAVAESDGG